MDEHKNNVIAFPQKEAPPIKRDFVTIEINKSDAENNKLTELIKEEVRKVLDNRILFKIYNDIMNPEGGIFSNCCYRSSMPTCPDPEMYIDGDAPTYDFNVTVNLTNNITVEVEFYGAGEDIGEDCFIENDPDVEYGYMTPPSDIRLFTANRDIRRYYKELKKTISVNGRENNQDGIVVFTFPGCANTMVRFIITEFLYTEFDEELNDD